MTPLQRPSGGSWDPGLDPQAYQDAAQDNREEVLHSEVCGCFGCGQLFAPTAITRWWDEGTTACCPHCGQASAVVGSASGLALDPESLGLARAHLLGVDAALPAAPASPAPRARPWWRLW